MKLTNYILLLVGFSGISAGLFGQRTVTLPITEDARLSWHINNSSVANTNYGNDPYCRAETWTNGGQLYKVRSLMKADLQQIPQNAYIADAKLYLYSPHDPNITFDIHSIGNSQSTIRRIVTSWDEATITWNTFDITTHTATQGAVNVPAATTETQDYVIDLTNMVQGWVNGTYPNHGISLALNTEGTYRRLFFASSDYSNPDKHPTLEITYYYAHEIGQGTHVSSLYGDMETTPFGTYYEDNRSQYIFTASELFQSGLREGNIHAIAFDVDSANTSMSNFNLKMGHTGLNSFLQHSFTDSLLSLHYSGTYTPYKGWSTIHFDTPFTWDGTSNIIVDVCFDNNYYVENSTVRYSVTQNNTVIGQYADDEVGCSFNYSYDDPLNNRPNIRLYKDPGILYSSPQQPVLQNAVPDGGQNYIRTLVAMDTCTGGSLITSSPSNINENIQYFDGLGRPIKEVMVRATPQGRDVVTPIKYDAFGRQEYSFQPYPSPVATPGSYRENDIDEQHDFYKAYFDLGTSENPYAYSRTVYESSPLNRVFEQGAPGKPWQPNESGNPQSGHTQKFYYETNIEDQVRLWKVNASNQLVSTGHYGAGELYKNTVEGEDKDAGGNGVSFTTEYKDKQGNVVLKVSSANSTELKTYYIYDDFGLLRAVLPPKYSTLLGSGNLSINPSQTWGSFFELGYYYTYDARKRMATKKLPGAEPVFMVYDNRDRLVLTQDGNQRPGKRWTYTKYDVLNRPVITGEYTDNQLSLQTQASMQALVDGRYTGSGAYQYHEGRDSTSSTHYYTNNLSFPRPGVDGSSGSFRYYTVSYYDDYYFLAHFPDSIKGGYSPAAGPAGLPDAAFGRLKGQLTGSKVFMLDYYTSVVCAVNYYDERYRVIQQQRTFYPTGHGVASTVYGFTGNVLASRETQRVGQQSHTLYTSYTYDHALRPLETRMSYNHGDTLLLSQMSYNELGQLERKDLHSADYQNVLQSVDYRYNIRGWLTGINDPADLQYNSALFAMELFYDSPEAGLNATPGYNGNIPATVWRHDSDFTREAYVYAYDGFQRLAGATYKVNPGTGWNTSTKFKVDNISYDTNGNLVSLRRTGSQGTLIDNLLYTYLNNGNRLLYVSDFATGEGFYDGNSSGDDYTYDVNGNMTEDRNKGISIDYNRLNLPCFMYESIYSDEIISYLYDASGNKWVKYWYDGYGSGGKAYFGSFVYDNPYGTLMLDYILTPEGMISVEGGTPEHHYFLRDHLGNTRVVFTDQNGDGWVERGESSTEIQQRTDYYPFGMSHADMLGGDNKYLYNGKELQDDVLNGRGLEWYDYGLRFYDPQLARWHIIDPASELMSSWSPYNYCYGNPIRFEDKDGAIPLETIWDVANVAMGVTSMVNNIKQGNYSAALADAGGALVDVAAVVVPYVPGGASTAIKAARAADNVVDAAKATDKLADVAEVADKGQIATKADDILQGGNRLPDSKIKEAPSNRGNAPIGEDGKPVELHHRDQTPDGPIDEMTQTDHRGGDNYKKNHENTGQGKSQIDRKDFKEQRKTHWEFEWDNGRWGDNQ